MAFLDFITSHWGTISTVILAIMVPAQVIVNLTPTPVDDAIFGKVYRVVEILAGVVSPKAKQYPGEEAFGKQIEEFVLTKLM